MDATTVPYELVDGVLLHQAAVAAHELGLYRCLAAGSLPSSELALRLDLTPRVVEMLGGAAETFGLVARSDGGLALTGAGRETLLSPSTLLSFGVSLLRDAYTYGALLSALRADGPAARPFEDGWFGASVETFAEAMHEHSRDVAARWPALVGLEGHRRLLDVGGGSGTHAIAAVRAAPDLGAVILERADMASCARARLAAEGLTGRVEVVVGDMWSGAWPEADLHLLSDVLHDWRPAESRRLVERSHATLPSGGRLAVLEMALRPGRPDTAAVLASGISMLLLTGGQQYSVEELERFLLEAGFMDVVTRDVLGPWCVTTGRKP